MFHAYSSPIIPGYTTCSMHILAQLYQGTLPSLRPRLYTVPGQYMSHYFAAPASVTIAKWRFTIVKCQFTIAITLKTGPMCIHDLTTKKHHRSNVLLVNLQGRYKMMA